MMLQVISLCLFVVYGVEALYEGDFCVKGGSAGICKNLEQCPPAIADIKRKKVPQICGFSGIDSIVCCVDKDAATELRPVATTTQRVSTTTMYVPEEPDYKDRYGVRNKCQPVAATSTIPKTGRKAIDKCIEYQERFVYPCEKGVSLGPETWSRGSACHHSTTELVIGGENAKQYEFSHMVMVGYGNDINYLVYQCGGAVVSERFILTAGHCISGRDVGNATFIAAGILNRSEAIDHSKVYRIKRVHKHPQYEPPGKYNDIALFELDRDLPLSQYLVPACVHTGETVNDTRVLATGWGHTKDQDRNSEAEVMQKVILEKFHELECAGNFIPNRNFEQGFNPYSQLCFGHRTQAKDTCQGDSGGPLQIKNDKIHCMYTIVALTSFGRKCGMVALPGVYTKVAPYASWIEGVVWP